MDLSVLNCIFAAHIWNKNRMKGGLMIFLVVFILIAGGVVAYSYLYPKQALRMIRPELSKVEKIRVQLKRDTAFIQAKITLVNNGIFKLNVDSLIYNVKLDTSVLFF